LPRPYQLYVINHCHCIERSTLLW